MLVLTPDADTALRSIYDQNPRLGDRLDEWLDRLEEDPSQAAVRRHRFHRPALWMIFVRDHSADYWILWDEQDGKTVVRYIGPSLT